MSTVVLLADAKREADEKERDEAWREVKHARYAFFCAIASICAPDQSEEVFEETYQTMMEKEDRLIAARKKWNELSGYDQ